MTDIDVDDVLPATVPARMLNEYVYCPRLFFLEWVDAQFAENADVAEGLRRHRVVDTPTGAAPLPGDGELRAARSLELSSATLGISAKLDLVEAADGGVVPVDVKKGSPRDDGTVWEADAVQVCAQALLLREHGYTCDHAEIYYATTRRRLRVELTDELIDKTTKLVEQARLTAVQEVAPPPLVASPKCPRCSLVGICLPDEINALSQRGEQAPRRLIPADPDASPLYVTEQGAWVGIDGGRLRVSKARAEIVSVRLIDVTHVCVYGNVQVGAQALREMFRRSIDVFHFSYGGWLQGISTGLPSKNVTLRLRQLTAASRGDLTAPRAMIAGKIRNSRVLLRRNARDDVARTGEQLRALEALALIASGAPELRGIEGTAARLYFGALPAAVAERQRLPGVGFTFEGRSRRPPADALNCLLSFCYGLLTKEVTGAALAVGFDPYVGLFHRPRFGRPALALDLAEEFRPLLADSVVLGLVNNGEVKVSDFLVRAGGVGLTADGRKAVLRAWERRMQTQVRHPMFGYRVTYRRVIELQARLLAAALLGEVPAYAAFTTR